MYRTELNKKNTSTIVGECGVQVIGCLFGRKLPISQPWIAQGANDLLPRLGSRSDTSPQIIPCGPQAAEGTFPSLPILLIAVEWLKREQNSPEQGFSQPEKCGHTKSQRNVLEVGFNNILWHGRGKNCQKCICVTAILLAETHSISHTPLT